MKRLGDYIRPVDVRNRDLKVTRLLGVSITKEFMHSIANIVGTDLSAYKVVTKGQFAYGPVTSRNGDKISVALLDGYDDAIISQAYTVFEVVDKNALDPEYLMMWFRRPEFDRYARFHSHGSAREVFDWEEMCEVQVPVPAINRRRIQHPRHPHRNQQETHRHPRTNRPNPLPPHLRRQHRPQQSTKRMEDGDVGGSVLKIRKWCDT